MNGGVVPIERIFFLMSHPDVRSIDYMARFEVSRSTFERDKAYVRDRLWNYEVRVK